MSDQATASRATSKTRRGSLAKRIVVASLMVPAAAVGVLSAGASPASATSGGIIGYHEIRVFPTWFWGSTTFCARNVETVPGKYAKIRVTPMSNPTLFDDVYANPGQTTCIRRSWWGSAIVANNLSVTGARADVYTY